MPLSIFLPTVRLRKQFWSSKSCGTAALCCFASFQKSWENRVTFSPVSVIAKRKEETQLREGVKTKTSAMHFPFTVPNSQMLPDELSWCRRALAPRERGHTDVLSTREIFLTCRNFLLYFWEHFFSPNSPLGTWTEQTPSDCHLPFSKGQLSRLYSPGTDPKPSELPTKN